MKTMINPVMREYVISSDGFEYRYDKGQFPTRRIVLCPECADEAISEQWIFASNYKVIDGNKTERTNCDGCYKYGATLSTKLTA